MPKSIVSKLTLFVGVLVALNTGSLSGVAYIITSGMLRDQIHDRLTTVAADRQGILLNALKQEGERAAALANWPRMRELLSGRDRGPIATEQIRAEAEPILSSVRANTTGLLAVWLEGGA